MAARRVFSAAPRGAVFASGGGPVRLPRGGGPGIGVRIGIAGQPGVGAGAGRTVVAVVAVSRAFSAAAPPDPRNGRTNRRFQARRNYYGGHTVMKQTQPAQKQKKGAPASVAWQQPLEFLEVSKSGEMFRNQATKQELMTRGLLRGVALRDLRPIDSQLTADSDGKNSSLGVTVHPECFIVSLGHLRLIAGSDRALVFDFDEPETAKFVALLSDWTGAKLVDADEEQMTHDGDAAEISLVSPVPDAADEPARGYPKPPSPSTLSDLGWASAGAPSRAAQQITAAMLSEGPQHAGMASLGRNTPENDGHRKLTAREFVSLIADHDLPKGLAPVSVGDGSASPVESVPFEFLVLECVLLDVWRELVASFHSLEPLIQAELARVTASPETPPLNLLTLRKRLAEQEKALSDVLEAVRMLWSNDEDMSAMYLTDKYVTVTGSPSVDFDDTSDMVAAMQQNVSKRENRSGNGVNPSTDVKGVNGGIMTPAMHEAAAWGGATARVREVRRRREDEHDEIEVLLETYMKQYQQVRQDVVQAQRQIVATDEFVAIQLDATRNRIMRLSLLLSMGTFSVTTCGLTSAIFGMNLVSGLEEHPAAFYLAVGGIGAGSALLFGLVYGFARRRGAW
jgi:Magnesium transporter MRS2-like